MITLPCDEPGVVAGIDMSAAQRKLTAVEWAAVYKSGVRFVYAKVAEADYPPDARCIDHARGARDTGLMFDVYGFFKSILNGRLQAESWARAQDIIVKALGSDELDLRFMIDFEDQDHIQVNLPQARDNLHACGERLIELTGERPLLYTGPGVMNLFRGHNIDLSFLLEYDVEIAHYRFHPVTGHDYGITKPTTPYPWDGAPSAMDKIFGWQWCGNKGPRIAGVPMDLDRDVYFGSIDSLMLWGQNKHMLLRDLGGTFPGGAAHTLGQADRAERDAEEDDEKPIS